MLLREPADASDFDWVAHASRLRISGSRGNEVLQVSVPR